MENVFENYCELHFPPSTDFQQGPCPMLVKAFYVVMDGVDPVHHCDQIGACGANDQVEFAYNSELAKMPPRASNAICQFCEESVEQVQNALSNPDSIDQVRRQADMLCEYFKVVNADKECRQLINKYLDQAITFVQNIDPLSYCRSIQLCSSGKPQIAFAKQNTNNKARADESEDLSKLPSLASFNDFGIETSVIIGPAPTNAEKAPESQLTNKHNTPSCLLCKTFVKEMFHFLRENKTEANIIVGLGEVCQALFPRNSPRLDECQSMVKAYTKELIQLLIDETDPEMVCVLLEQCVSAPSSQTNTIGAVQRQHPIAQRKGKIIDLAELMHSLDPTVKLRSARVCFECKMFIKYLKTTIEDSSSRDSIKQWLQQNLCMSIPDLGVQRECKQMIEEYADTFFAAVIGSLNPSEACASLGACSGKLMERFHLDLASNSESSLPSIMVSPIRFAQELHSLQSTRKQQPEAQLAGRNQEIQGQLCDQCVEIVSQIDEYVAQHPIDKDVSVLIDQVCNKLPDGSIRSECVYIIKAFGDQIAQAVANMENPRQLCSKFMLCQA